MQRTASRDEWHTHSAVPAAPLQTPAKAERRRAKTGLWVSIGVSRERAIRLEWGEDARSPGRTHGRASPRAHTPVSYATAGQNALMRPPQGISRKHAPAGYLGHFAMAVGGE